MNFSTSRRRKVGAWRDLLEQDATASSSSSSATVVKVNIPDNYFDSDDEREREREQAAAAAAVAAAAEAKQRKAEAQAAAAAAAAKPRPVVYMDIKAGSAAPSRRVVMELFADKVPRTAENFRALCTGELGSRYGTKLSYVGAPFHRVIPTFMAQGGDITHGDGTGGMSIYGPAFADEHWGRHDAAGLLSMANSGPGSNNSQFFITLNATPWLNRKHVVFGRVTKGMDVVRAIEALGSATGDPKDTIEVTACGQLHQPKATARSRHQQQPRRSGGGSSRGGGSRGRSSGGGGSGGGSSGGRRSRSRSRRRSRSRSRHRSRSRSCSRSRSRSRHRRRRARDTDRHSRRRRSRSRSRRRSNSSRSRTSKTRNTN